MPSTFSPSLRLELIGAGEQAGVWNRTTNSNLGDLIEASISGATNLDVGPSDITLTALNGVPDQARAAVLTVVGSPGTTRVITIPNVEKPYTVKNRSDATVEIKTAGGSPFAIPTLSEAYIFCDGNNVITGRVITDGANAFTSNTAPLNNTALTGIPTAPTATPGANTTQIATTAFVIDWAPSKTGTNASGTWGIDITGNAVTANNATTATALQTARTINGVSFNGSADITLPTVNTSGNQTIDDVKTFSSNPISSDAQSTAVNSLTRRDFVTGLDGTNVKLTGDQTIAGVKTFSSQPVITATQGANADDALKYGTINTANSALVKVALNADNNPPIFAARAWVICNSSGALGSGNVSSTSFLGSGQVRVNFSTAMPDTNYSVVAMPTSESSGFGSVFEQTRLTTYVQVRAIGFSDFYNPARMNVVVFR
jgi:hypothetical protein